MDMRISVDVWNTSTYMCLTMLFLSTIKSTSTTLTKGDRLIRRLSSFVEILLPHVHMQRWKIYVNNIKNLRIFHACVYIVMVTLTTSKMVHGAIFFLMFVIIKLSGNLYFWEPIV